jgi:hypothetical protein
MIFTRAVTSGYSLRFKSSSLEDMACPADIHGSKVSAGWHVRGSQAAYAIANIEVTRCT